MHLPSLLLVSTLLALPLPAPDNTVHFLYTGTRTYDASLSNINIFATGGTIAGLAFSTTQVTGYQAGAPGIQTLIDAVPSILNVSNVNGVQVSNVASDAITPAILLKITHQISVTLVDSYIQVWWYAWHGLSDSLEESVFFLDLTTRSEKPAVSVGTIRPATAILADEPINLLAAMTLIASPPAVGRGTMVVLNDRITSADYTTKTKH